MTRRLNTFELVSVGAAGVLSVAAGVFDLAGAGSTAVFLASAVALVALAWIVGMATEQLGESSGPKVGGVLNATFGNAAELIITIFAIRAGQLEVATASITGSILGNTLLVLGASFVVGGVRHGRQTFDRRIAGMNASMLALAVIGLGLPTAFAAARGTGPRRADDLRRDRRHPDRALRSQPGLLLPHGRRRPSRFGRAALAGGACDRRAARLDRHRSP